MVKSGAFGEVSLPEGELEQRESEILKKSLSYEWSLGTQRQTSEITDRRKFSYMLREWLGYSLLLPKKPLKTSKLIIKLQ